MDHQFRVDCRGDGLNARRPAHLGTRPGDRKTDQSGTPAATAAHLPEPGGPADFGYGIGIFTVAGWVGHNGSVPGYQTVAVHLPRREITLVVMINTDIAVPGRADPSEVLTTAITSVLTPENVYKL